MIPWPWYDPNSMVWYHSMSFHGMVSFHVLPWYGIIPCPWYDPISMVWYHSMALVWSQFHGMVWSHGLGMIPFPWYDPNGMIPFPWYGMIPIPWYDPISMVWSHGLGIIPFIWYDMIPSSGNLAGQWIQSVNLSCCLTDNSLPFLINCIARLIYWCHDAWNLNSRHACVQMFKSEFSTMPADKSICWEHTSGDSKSKIFWWFYSYRRTLYFM